MVMNFSSSSCLFKTLSLIVFMALYMIAIESARTKNIVILKKIECQQNAEYMQNESCRVKVINRHKRIIDMYVVPLIDLNLLQSEVSLYKRFSGWRPYYGKLNFSFCEFLGGKYNPIVNMLKSHIQRYSNMNHTCPYRAFEPLVLEKFDINGVNTGKLVAPEGDYRLDINIYEAKRLFLGTFVIYAEVKEVFA